MYISVGANLRNSKIPLFKGITDYGCLGYKKLFPRLQKIAHFSGPFFPGNCPNLGPQIWTPKYGISRISQTNPIDQRSIKRVLFDPFYSFYCINGPISDDFTSLPPSLTATPHYIPSERLPHTQLPTAIPTKAYH